MGGKHLHKLMDCLRVVVSSELVASSFVFLRCNKLILVVGEDSVKGVGITDVKCNCLCR